MIKDWLQVNDDGFGYPPSMSMSDKPGLFTFGGGLFAYNDHGLFCMDEYVFRKWDNLYVPGSGFTPLGAYLYCTNNGLWFIKQGEAFNNANWKQVNSQGVPAGAVPVPMTVFNGQIYATTRHVDQATGKDAFHIWRSQDIGKTAMNWQLVVNNSFGDPQNNHGVDFMFEFNGHLYALTDTLEGVFGGTQAASGIEVWESPNGDAGTWIQVNQDGFGTEITLSSGQPMRTNHMTGSWAVYQAPGQNQPYLYIGTKSHHGAEVLRYDGSGLNGWKNVTPPWAGGGFMSGSPGRNEAMAVFQGDLYLAEGFPSANLAKYNGANWSIEINGPNPFDPQDGGLSSAVVFKGHLYVHTIHAFGIGATKGDQVWGYPFKDPMILDFDKWLKLVDIFKILPDRGDPPGMEFKQWMKDVWHEPLPERPLVDDLSAFIAHLDTLDEAGLREMLARLQSQQAQLEAMEKMIRGRLKG